MSHHNQYRRMLAPPNHARKVDVPLSMVKLKLEEGYVLDDGFPDRRPVYTREMPNRHVGTPAFIAASGPSISAPPLSAILDFIRENRCVTWATNDVWKCCAGSPLPAEYVVILDDHFWTKNLSDLLAYFARFHRALPVLGFDINQNVDYQRIGIETGRLATETETPDYELGHFFHGQSSGVAAVQMAMFCGCNPIYLLGHDCGTQDGKTHGAGLRSKYELERDYPQKKMMLPGYRTLGLHAEALGRKIINLSPRSAIPFFEKVDQFGIAEP